MKENIRIGTCSWKYDSWRGLIYPEQGPVNYLREYSYYYNAVEVDQWFWSLFNGDKVVLPKPDVVREYAESVPDGFIFSIKVPNSITLTHHYTHNREGPLQANPYFLSIDLFKTFLDTLEPLSGHIGPLIFQFEYLNKKKMPDMDIFLERLQAFSRQLPGGYTYCVEIRNPNYLDSDYFSLLSSVNLYHVFLHGYYMPSIFDVYEEHKEQVRDLTVIRLHGPDRKKIEKRTQSKWNRIVDPKDNDLLSLQGMLKDLTNRKVYSFVFVNNHFEGSAPRTISRIHSIFD